MSLLVMTPEPLPEACFPVQLVVQVYASALEAEVSTSRLTGSRCIPSLAVSISDK